MPQGFRIYLPDVESSDILSALQGLQNVQQIRSAQRLPFVNPKSLEDVWHVEFEHFSSTPDALGLKQGLPSCYDEIEQVRIEPMGDVPVVTTTYLRSDIPDARHLNYFRTENVNGVVRLFKGQHPSLSDNTRRLQGTIVQTDAPLVKIMNLIKPYIQRCPPIVTQEIQFP